MKKVIDNSDEQDQLTNDEGHDARYLFHLSVAYKLDLPFEDWEFLICAFSDNSYRAKLSLEDLQWVSTKYTDPSWDCNLFVCLFYIIYDRQLSWTDTMNLFQFQVPSIEQFKEFNSIITGYKERVVKAHGTQRFSNLIAELFYSIRD